MALAAGSCKGMTGSAGTAKGITFFYYLKGRGSGGGECQIALGRRLADFFFCVFSNVFPRKMPILDFDCLDFFCFLCFFTCFSKKNAHSRFLLFRFFFIKLYEKPCFSRKNA